MGWRQTFGRDKIVLNALLVSEWEWMKGRLLRKDEWDRTMFYLEISSRSSFTDCLLDQWRSQLERRIRVDNCNHQKNVSMPVFSRYASKPTEHKCQSDGTYIWRKELAVCLAPNSHGEPTGNDEWRHYGDFTVNSCSMWHRTTWRSLAWEWRWGRQHRRPNDRWGKRH